MKLLLSYNKNWNKRMSPPEQLPSSEQGIEQSRKLVDDFDRLITSRAETFARQRRATRIDDADFSSAYRDLLADEVRGWQFWFVQLLGSALILLGGIGLSYAVSNWPTTTSASTPAFVLFLVIAGLCAIAGLALQHLPLRFR